MREKEREACWLSSEQDNWICVWPAPSGEGQGILGLCKESLSKPMTLSAWENCNCTTRISVALLSPCALQFNPRLTNTWQDDQTKLQMKSMWGQLAEDRPERISFSLALFTTHVHHRRRGARRWSRKPLALLHDHCTLLYLIILVCPYYRICEILSVTIMKESSVFHNLRDRSFNSAKGWNYNMNSKKKED